MKFAAIPDRAWFSALALGCFGLVAIGMGLQTMLHLAPCPLCIFQRVLYLLIGTLALGGFALPFLRQLWGGLCAALSALGAGVAAYQSWMQAYPALAKECSYSDPNVIERLVDWLGMQSPGFFLATGFCTSREWELFGWSMANWSVLIFSGILVYVLLLIGSKRA